MRLRIWKGDHRAFPPVQAAGALLLGILMLFISTGPAFAQEVPGGCGSLRSPGRFGPYDYRADKYIPDIYLSHKGLLGPVEDHHFSPAMEAALHRKTGLSVLAVDLAYTLHAFPNHHRALIALEAAGENEITSKPYRSIECWFVRAITWRPDDNIVRMIYARYLSKMKRENEADQQLSFAASQAGDNAFTYQNIGLVYFDMKNYEKALIHAHKAYELGLGIPALKEQLKSVGKWSEPPGVPPVEPVKNPQ